MKPIYLDNHTTTRPSPSSVLAMHPFLTEHWGVPTAPHAMGSALLGAMEEAYRAIYALLGAREEDAFIFTSSGTEAVNHVVWASYLDRARDFGRTHFITSAVDEAPIILALERLEQLGCETTLVPVNEKGIVTPEALGDALRPRTALVSLSWANALTGVVQPVAELAVVCRERGVWLHLDATHILGKLPFDLDEIAPDFLSFNGDHLHAPKGTGGLWVRSGLRLSPMLLGGMEQDGQRAGPFSVALLAALGVAAKEAVEARDHIATEIARLRDRLERQLVERISGAQVLMAEGERLPTTSVIAFPGVTADALLYLLNRRGVFASFGGGSYQQLGIQLETTKIVRPVATSAISLSLSRETTEGEIDEAIHHLVQTVTELRQLSYGVIHGT